MKENIPFVKEINFKTKIATITSISLEHEEKILNGEVSGDFIVFGDYKIHNDTTEKELFKFRLPFSAILPDNINPDTVSIDINDFTYDQVNDETIKVNIDFCLQGEFLEDKIEREIEEYIIPKKVEEEILAESETNSVPKEVKIENPELAEERNDVETKEKEAEEKIPEEELERKEIEVDIKKETEQTEEVEPDNKEINEVEDEYITYHIHIIKENETLEDIINEYNTNLEYLKIYNDITNINIGDKIIIPEEKDE